MTDAPRRILSFGWQDQKVRWCDRPNVAATRVVAYDLLERNARERAKMLRRLGVRHMVWDWRDEDAMQFDEELDAMREQGVELSGLWCPAPLPDPSDTEYNPRNGAINPHVRAFVSEVSRRGLSPDLWVTLEFGEESSPTSMPEDQARAHIQRAADHLEPLVRLAASHGMCVLLTNHLGFFGEPANLVKVIKVLGDRQLLNVGIAYQQQHGHAHIANFHEHLAVMGEHLVAIALNGMDPDGVETGRKVLPYGSGRADRKLAHTIAASGWEGHLAVQGLSRDDAETRLEDSLDGLEWVVARQEGRRFARPKPRIPLPAWGAANGRAERAHVSMPPRPAAEPMPSSAAAAAVTDAIPTVTRTQPSEPAREDSTPGAELPITTSPMSHRTPGTSPAPAVADDEEPRAKRGGYVPTMVLPAPPREIPHRDVSRTAPDPYTAAIHALLTHLESVGFRGAPRSFGWDSHGRHLVEWIDGVRADKPEAPEDALNPERIGAFMREMHDALESFVPPPGVKWFEGLPGPRGELIIHQDIGPSNMVVTGDDRLVAIDWDAAAPGTRLWDLAQAAHSFAPLARAGVDPTLSAQRLARFADGYGLTMSEREELVPLLAMRSERMYEYLDHMRVTGQSPWSDLWERGVGKVWQADAEWIREHDDAWRGALLSQP